MALICLGLTQPPKEKAINSETATKGKAKKRLKRSHFRMSDFDPYALWQTKGS